jgi:hypothetical protein
MTHRYQVPGLILAAIAPVAIVAAADFLSLEEAQKAVFPEADHFQEIFVSQTPGQLQSLVSRAGEQPTHGVIRIWRATRAGTLLGHFFLDEVVGRQNLITYAVGIDAGGTLRNLEIMAYRESHGGEVRNPAWRNQFNGRHGLDEIRFRTDIKNISGATLSSEHVTEGVRWLMALWQATLRPAGAAD